MGTQTIDSDVMGILSRATCEDHALRLPNEKLSRELYLRVNEVLERLGGKWRGGKTKAHLFDDDPAPMLAEILATSIMPEDNPLDFYPTPPEVVDILLNNIALPPETILEPSAGDGAIVRALQDTFPRANIDAVEINPKLATKLRRIEGVRVIEGDFLQHTGAYDVVVMNPPFTAKGDGSAYATHIVHAFGMVKPGGVLSAVAPAGLKFITDKRITRLREIIRECRGTIMDLPTYAFKESGTGVQSVIVYMEK